LPALCFRAGAWGIDHRGVEPVQLIFHERPPEQVAFFHRHRPEPRRPFRRLVERRQRLDFALYGMHRRRCRQRQGKGPRPCEQVHHLANAACRFLHKFHHRRFRRLAGLQKTARRRRDMRCTGADQRRGALHRDLSVDRKTRQSELTRSLHKPDACISGDAAGDSRQRHVEPGRGFGDGKGECALRRSRYGGEALQLRQQGRQPRRDNGAVGHGHDLVAPASVKADEDRLAGARRRKHRPSPCPGRQRHHRIDRRINALKGQSRDHLPALELQIGSI